MGLAAVAKRKTGPKPKSEGPRGALIAVKCRQPYKDWVIEHAKKLRMTPSQLIDRALVVLAKSEGWKEPPER